jgi:pyruvate dehydrogenase E1 component
LPEVFKAAGILAGTFDLAADIWSVTSYKQLYDNANNAERGNRIPNEQLRFRSHIEKCFPQEAQGDEKRLFVAACDYLKALPLSVAKWFPGKFIALGTDGFGRSDMTPALRDFFEVDAKHIVFAALSALSDEGTFSSEELLQAIDALGIDMGKLQNPADAL